MESSEKSFPFDAEDSEGVYDRTYVADDFARYFRTFISSGLFMNDPNSLMITSNDNMTVSLQPGSMIIDGYRYDNTDEIIINISAADGVLNRIDRIAIVWDKAAREIHYEVIEGTPSYNPITPDIRRNSDYKDYILADIYVGAGVVSISQANITDRRLDTSVCGLAAAFSKVDTEDLYRQIQAELERFKTIYEKNFDDWSVNEKAIFLSWIQLNQDEFTDWKDKEKNEFIAWFDNVKDILDESVAGKLQNEINDILDRITCNGKDFYFDEHDDVAGWNSSSTRDEKTFHPFAEGIAPKNAYNIAAICGDGYIKLLWNDPGDAISSDGIIFSRWGGTKLVYKEDSFPTKVSDGTLLVDNKVLNQYAEDGFILDGLVNNKSYYFALFPYSKSGAVNVSSENMIEAMPSLVKLDPTTELKVTAKDSSVLVTWTDPAETKTESGATANWTKTLLVYKEGAYPASYNDGTVIESDVHNQYSSNALEISGIENGKEIYFATYVVADIGTVTSDNSQRAIAGLYATVTVSTEEATLIGKTVTATYGEDGSVSGVIGSMGFVQLKIPYIGEVTFSATDGSETATSKITIESFIPMPVSLSFYAEWCYSMHIGSDSDPDAAVTYVGDNANFTPAKMNYDTGTFDWGSWADAPFIPKPCMLKSDGTVDYYLDPNDYALKEDGTSSDIGNTSYDGNAMVEWGDGVRPIYLTIVPDTDITQATIHISNYVVDDTSTCYPFMDSNGNIIKHFYTPCYAGSLINNKLRSISGQVVMQSKTAEQEMTYAQANGDGYNIELTCDRILINFLLILMSKTLNTENAYGKGNQSGYVNNASSNYGMHNTGTMNSKGLFWGKNVSSASDTSGVKVFGMEDWWGNQWRRMAGLITIAGKIYIKLTHSTADGSTTTGYNTTGSGYISTGLSCSGTSGGFISKVTYNPKYAIPTVASGSETTYYADGLWFNASDTRFAIVGGDCGSGSRCGAFCLDLYCLASDADWNVGAALSCKPLASEA